jgi:hypothetical protein
MSELKEVPQALTRGLVTLPPEHVEQEKCPVILVRGKRTGEVCGGNTWGQPKCSAHMLADKRKYGSSNPFAKVLEEGKEPKPFEIVGEEEDDEFEDFPPVQPPPPPEQELDDIEEITISLKNVKAICLKIMRQR